MKNEKVALITGSSKGIGKAIALKLAQEKINIIINYKSDFDGEMEVEKLCKDLGVETLVIQGDVSNESDVEKIFGEIKSKFGKLDILINNAGITKDGLTMVMKSEDFKDVIDVNLVSAFYTMKHSSKIMTRIDPE